MRKGRTIKAYADPPSWLCVGALVDYFSISGEPPTKTGVRVRSEPWQLGHGQWVVKIDGVPDSFSHTRSDSMSQFTQYRRKQIAELRPYEPGESMDGISVSAPDKEAGSPKAGDMIARNPKNHVDRWLVAAAYFADNFAPLKIEIDEQLHVAVRNMRHCIVALALEVDPAIHAYISKAFELIVARVAPELGAPLSPMTTTVEA